MLAIRFNVFTFLRIVNIHAPAPYLYVLVNRAPIAPAAIAQYGADGSPAVVLQDGDPQTNRVHVLTADLAALTPCGQIRR